MRWVKVADVARQCDVTRLEVDEKRRFLFANRRMGLYIKLIAHCELPETVIRRDLTTNERADTARAGIKAGRRVHVQA